MSRDLIDDLKRLESYGFKKPAKYVLATPELLSTDVAKRYLQKELLTIGFHEKQLPKVCRLIRNIIATAQHQHLTAKKVPYPESYRKLFEAGFHFTTSSVKPDGSCIPMSVAIQTKLGKIVVWMSLPLLEDIVAISDWGLPE